MKREKPDSLISKWKQVFTKGKKKTPDAGPASLTLIRKEPVTFQLSKLDSPKDFELMCFVIKAIAKAADKSYKTVLHIERTRTGSRLVACDGWRLHIAEISKRIKSGDYKPHVTKDVVTLGNPVEGIEFPSWAKSIPDNTQKRGVINLEESGLGRDRNKTEKLSIALNAFTKQTGGTVNLRYLEDLTKREWAVYSPDGNSRVIVLRQKNGNAVEPDEKSPVAVIVPIAQAA